MKRFLNYVYSSDSEDDKPVFKTIKNSIALTFGDAGENHVGMQKIGKLASDGYSKKDLENAKKYFEEKGCLCELVDLSIEDIKDENASVLIIRGGVNCLLENEMGADILYKEQSTLEKDTKVFMYGRVVNKHARHNLCFGEENQDPDYENKKGRIIAFRDVPNLLKIKNSLENFLGEKGKDMIAEGNYYYDVKKCGIGYHGDAERKRVVACKLASSKDVEMYLHYQWYKNSEPVGKNFRLTLFHGDIYIMGEKAVGYDWKKKSIYTLRHAAGCEKYTKIKKEK